MEDLKQKLESFDEIRKSEYETRLWQALNSAADDLLEKTDALPEAQARVPLAEAAYKEAKAKYDDAVKNRLALINQKVADEESSSATSRYQTVTAG